jgi:2'-5' RNA ligase
MKFFIAHIIKGECGNYHEKITRSISERFGTEPLHERLPPHITIVPPFEWYDQRQPMAVMEDALVSVRPGFFYMSSFDHFNTHTIYLSVVPSREMEESVRALKKQFRMFMREEEQLRNFIAHSSVARNLEPSKFSAIWKFLEGESPDFQCSFDSVSLLLADRGAWNVVTEIDLNNGRVVADDTLNSRMRPL